MSASRTVYEVPENIEKLQDAEVYPLWKFQIEIHMDAADLLDVILIDPSATLKETPDWKRKDARAKRIIVSALEKQSLIHVVTCSNSYEKLPTNVTRSIKNAI